MLILSRWILSASRTGLYLGKRRWGGGRADFVLVPPTLSEKWALNPHLAAKVKAVLSILGSLEYTCDVLSFKATWFLKVIFTGISALSWLLLAGMG